MADSIKLRVSRYRPETDSEPHWQEYEVPLRKEWTVLDGLNHVKNEVDTTLSFRWSCRMGICGSCGMTVDGEPKLTCATFLSDYAPGPVTVEPLSNFPVVRDLVVDLSDFMAKLPRVKPWIIREDDDRFLTHLLVYRNPDGTSRVERLPVTITRWPPGERVYGR